MKKRMQANTRLLSSSTGPIPGLGDYHRKEHDYLDLACDYEPVCTPVSPQSLNDYAAEINRTATEHGWWEDTRTTGDIIALCHSELSEALEDFRERGSQAIHGDVWLGDEQSPKPDGFWVEMADVIIRILDYAAQVGVDMDDVVLKKMAYNETRPYRHGGKKL